MKPTSLTIVIVIVNWNAGTLLRECLASIDASAASLPAGCSLRTVVVDNGSTDGSDQDLPSLAHPFELIRNGINRGFAAACNQGAAAQASDLILFLNPDTRLHGDSLAAPLALLERGEHAGTGIVGIAMIDDSGRPAPSCARFPRARHFACQALGLERRWPRLGTYMRERDCTQSGPVDQVIGAFFMIRGELFRALGGFDERFFVYFEEVDLALRARQAGWSSHFLAEASAYHKGGGTSEAVKERRLFYSLRSRLLYGRKHFAPAERALLWAVTWGLEPLGRAAHLALTGRWREIAQLAGAYKLLWRDRKSTA